MFLRALGCVSSGFRKLRTGDCRGFKPARADGFAFHPHGTLISPDSAYRNRDDVNLASLGRLESALDRLQRGRPPARDHAPLQPLPRRVRLPDAAARPHRRRLARARRTAGCSAPPTGRGATRACGCSPSTSGTTSRCGAPVPPFAGWQSGLRFLSGKPKPALAHFDTPMQVDAARSRLWGQARPGGAQTVTVERRLRGAKRYGLLARVRTDARGYWTLKRRLTRGARYRFRTAAATSASFRR